MQGVEDCSIPHTKGSNSLDHDRHSKMFRPSCTGPFSLTDLDMWDTRSRLSAQTSAWCGMATVSGTGFLSKVSTSTSGSTGGFRRVDSGLRRWQSLSHLAADSSTKSFSPCLESELRATRGESNFRQSELVQWLQDAHEHLESKLECLRTRDAQLSYHITTAQLLGMKHKLLEVISTLQHEEEPTNLSQFEKSQKQRELHDKILKLEKDLLLMRLTLDRGSKEQPPGRTPGSLSRTLPEKQKVDTELFRERETETLTKTQEEERNQVPLQLQSSTEKTLLNQIEELNQRLSHTLQNHSPVQEQLTEANNKISQACLEKAILSTQVLKLEDNIKDLKAKLNEALSDKQALIQEKTDLQKKLQLERTEPGDDKQGKETVLVKEKSEVLREVNEKLTCELEMIKQKFEIMQNQLQELTAEKVNSFKQIRDLEAEKAQLITEKEQLRSKIHEFEDETMDKLRGSLGIVQLEKQRLQDQCLCLEAKLLESEEKLQLQLEEYRKKDAVRVQNIEELKAVASHWTEKWQKVALTLQSTQEELENLKKNNSKNELQVKAGHLATETEKLQKKGEKDKEQIDNGLQQKASLDKLLTDNRKESDSLLRLELDACKQELELERSRSQILLDRYRDKGVEAVQTQDKETVTDLSESSLLSEPPSDSHSSQNKYPQVCIQNSEIQWLKIKLAERERELMETTEALTSLERMRETEKTEAQIKISALELKLMKNENCQDGGAQANDSTTDSLRDQLEESRRRVNQLQQEKMQAVQRLQTLKHLFPMKEEKQSVEGRKDKAVGPVIPETDQQRRMITEQLKNLFKEREEKEARKVDKTSAAAAQTEASSSQERTFTPKAVKTAVDRWNWQQSSGLMPVFEEDEEEEEEPGKEAHAQVNINHERHQMSATNATDISLEETKENLPQVLRFKQKIQDLHTTAEKVSQSDVNVPNLNSDEVDLQLKPYSLYPDGIFLAERVDICSPDEDEEEEEDK